MKKAQQMFALAMVVIGLSFGVAGCQKAQEPAAPPQGEMKKAAPPTATNAAPTAPTPATPAGGVKTTTSTTAK